MSKDEARAAAKKIPGATVVLKGQQWVVIPQGHPVTRPVFGGRESDDPVGFQATQEEPDRKGKK